MSFTTVPIVLPWLLFLYGSEDGAIVAGLTEIVPASVRTAGWSLAGPLATALFGGSTPLVSASPTEATGRGGAGPPAGHRACRRRC
ncbi:hypothetical protein [Methylobacterium nonmethylotrophicum]|uniref:hypothetical protein n=1 Tax=Methylobacterium nonmethylotrophicum TaxID=1141884 RepID=UPI00197B0E6B|nr:hypothetical protein [Methylobacterium nonmethylotrophicum]